MRATGLVLAIAFLASCAAEAKPEDASDANAEAGAVQASTVSFVGLYTTHATTHQNGDVTALDLQAAGSYVRTRCYHASCALPVPETDHYDTYLSSAGKTYVRFYSFTVTRDASGNLVTTPRVADVFEIAKTSSGIKLRKSYSTRWVSLSRTTATSRCTATGGTDAGGACTCPAAASDFVPGAGGCIVAPGANETNCDASNGLWTDDDSTLIGAYCECGFGRYDDASGACAAI